MIKIFYTYRRKINKLGQYISFLPRQISFLLTNKPTYFWKLVTSFDYIMLYVITDKYITIYLYDESGPYKEISQDINILKF